MKLSPSEISKLKEFIRLYYDMFQKFSQKEKELTEIEEKKEQLVKETTSLAEELEKIRVSEFDFQKTITAKYGNANIDFETFEIRQA